MDYVLNEDRELWREIPQTPYEISNLRRVRRLYKFRGKKVDPHFTFLSTINNVVNIHGKKLNVDKLMLEIWGKGGVENLAGEQWADIKGYEGDYQISTFGRVRSKARYVENRIGRKVYKKPQIIKSTRINSGYEVVGLYGIGGKGRHLLIHRLVAEHFLPRKEDSPYVNHKDENKLNNNVDNLEWCTWEYNCRYGTCQERRKETRIKNNGGKYGVKRNGVGNASVKE